MNIFDLTKKTDENLFYSRQDLNDIRMGDIVKRAPSDYEKVNVVILGCPQDEGVRRNKGREGASLAPTEIRRAFYQYVVDESHSTLSLFDLGDIRLGKILEETHDILYRIVRTILKDEKKLVVLGGGNDISYPNCSALSDITDNLLVFNIDRHYDVRADIPRNSGTPYRQLIEEKRIRPELFYEIGINSFANSPLYKQYLEEKGAHIYNLGDVREKGSGSLIHEIVERTDTDGIFFGFDLDSVRAVDAPGVSDTSPMGLTAREICAIADVAASDLRTRIIEITEVNPIYDTGGITSKLAANIIMRALAVSD